MYPWISSTLDFWLQFCEKMCGLYMYVYGIPLNIVVPPHCAAGIGICTTISTFTLMVPRSN